MNEYIYPKIAPLRNQYFPDHSGQMTFHIGHQSNSCFAHTSHTQSHTRFHTCISYTILHSHLCIGQCSISHRFESVFLFPMVVDMNTHSLGRFVSLIISKALYLHSMTTEYIEGHTHISNRSISSCSIILRHDD